MPRYLISPSAEGDIESVLAWTHDRFGEQARLRYEALLVQAIIDVAECPELAGSSSRPEIAPGARTYHLHHSRNRVSAKAGRVKSPRHLLLYRVGTDGTIEIGRVLHDSMDLERHLPEDYGGPDDSDC